jgi:hypothetical protein
MRPHHWQVAVRRGGHLSQKTSSPASALPSEAVPSVGFVHSSFEPYSGGALASYDQHSYDRDLARGAGSQRRGTEIAVGLGTVALVTMAVAFGPLLTWLMFR